MREIAGYVAVLALLTLPAGISIPARARAADPITREEQPRAKCSERLGRILESPGSDEPLKLWIYFRDHGPFPLRAEESISERSLDRRRVRSHSATDRFDLPVYQSYISAVRAHAVGLRHVSRYFNAVNAFVKPSCIRAIS